MSNVRTVASELGSTMTICGEDMLTARSDESLVAVTSVQYTEDAWSRASVGDSVVCPRLGRLLVVDMVVGGVVWRGVAWCGVVWWVGRWVVGERDGWCQRGRRGG